MFGNNNNDFQCKPEKLKISSEHFQHGIFIMGISAASLSGRIVHLFLWLCALHTKTWAANKWESVTDAEQTLFILIPAAS